jgi:hypothetical protein
MINVLVVLPIASAESSGTMRQLASASCGVRQVPFLEIRSLSVARSMQVVNEVLAVAGVDKCTVNEKSIKIANGIDSQRNCVPGEIV